MTLSRKDRIDRFVARRQAALKGKEHTWSKLRVVLRECGWKRRGAENLQRIQAGCEKAGIYPEPMLTAPGLDREETIYFSHIKPRPYVAEHYSPHPAFSSEKALQRFLAQNLNRIPKLAHLKSPILEYRLPSGRRIDILCREKRTDAYVVIELKKLRVDPVGQIERYLVEVDRSLARKASPYPEVRGIIITGQPNAVLERSLSARVSNYRVSWFLYRVKLELVERARAPGRSSHA